MTDSPKQGLRLPVFQNTNQSKANPPGSLIYDRTKSSPVFSNGFVWSDTNPIPSTNNLIAFTSNGNLGTDTDLNYDESQATLNVQEINTDNISTTSSALNLSSTGNIIFDNSSSNDQIITSNITAPSTQNIVVNDLTIENDGNFGLMSPEETDTTLSRNGNATSLGHDDLTVSYQFLSDRAIRFKIRIQQFTTSGTSGPMVFELPTSSIDDITPQTNKSFTYLVITGGTNAYTQALGEVRNGGNLVLFSDLAGSDFGSGTTVEVPPQNIIYKRSDGI